MERPEKVDSTSFSKVFLGVGGIAALIILYLLFDWMRDRRDARRLEERRRLAKEAWKEELRAMKNPDQDPG